MAKRKIVVLTSSFGKADPTPLERLHQAGFEVVLNPHNRKVVPEEIISLAFDAEGIIAGLEVYSKDTLNHLSRLKILSRVGVGLDSIDLAAAESQNIKVTITPDALTDSVAELTLGLILSLLRSVNVADAEIRREAWVRPMGHLLKEKTVGIVGLGRIGSRVAKLIENFGAHVIYFDPFVSTATYKKVSFAELLSQSDIVSLHCGADPSQKNALIGNQQLSCMKKSAYLINVARGALVDDAAVASAIQAGFLAGAAFDVYQNEPYHGPLTKSPRTVLTSHIGSYAQEARVQMELQAVENILRVLMQ